MGPFAELSSSRCFSGFQKVFQHSSKTLACEMKFGVYLPDTAVAALAAAASTDQQLGAVPGPTTRTGPNIIAQIDERPLPILFYLSGISCTEENFIVKSGMQRWASQLGVVVVNPDTSPRPRSVSIAVSLAATDASGATLASPPLVEGALVLGESAGFYLDATEQPWAGAHWKMATYLVDEFVPLVLAEFGPAIDRNRCGLFGHSMGGHGALTIGLKHPQTFRSISALAPVCNPSASPFSQRYLRAYLGPDMDKWGQYDAVELAKEYNGPPKRILIDQGSADTFLLDGTLLPDRLLTVGNPKLEFDYRLRDGYDHGYFYVRTFIGEHFQFHLDSWAGAVSN